MGGVDRKPETMTTLRFERQNITKKKSILEILSKKSSSYLSLAEKIKQWVCFPVLSL
jgi:hypothetical protein